MFEGKLTLDISQNLEKTLYKLCEALKGLNGSAAHPDADAPVSETAVPSIASVGADAQPSASIPVAPAPSYTLAQVSKAGADLLTADPSKMDGLRGLLAQFNVSSIPELKEEQLGAFATALRELGANI